MKKSFFALMGLAMLTLASCANSKDKAAESVQEAEATETVSPMDTALPTGSPEEAVGIEVATPDSANGVIAGGVDEVKIKD